MRTWFFIINYFLFLFWRYWLQSISWFDFILVLVLVRMHFSFGISYRNPCLHWKTRFCLNSDLLLRIYAGVFFFRDRFYRSHRLILNVLAGVCYCKLCFLFHCVSSSSRIVSKRMINHHFWWRLLISLRFSLFVKRGNCVLKIITSLRMVNCFADLQRMCFLFAPQSSCSFLTLFLALSLLFVSFLSEIGAKILVWQIFFACDTRMNRAIVFFLRFIARAIGKNVKKGKIRSWSNRFSRG